MPPAHHDPRRAFPGHSGHSRHRGGRLAGVRGPNRSGVAADGDFPVHFGPGTNVLWKSPVPSGHSSPIVWGDRLFLTGFEATIS